MLHIANYCFFYTFVDNCVRGKFTWRLFKYYWKSQQIVFILFIKCTALASRIDKWGMSSEQYELWEQRLWSRLAWKVCACLCVFQSTRTRVSGNKTFSVTKLCPDSTTIMHVSTFDLVCLTLSHTPRRRRSLWDRGGSIISIWQHAKASSRVLISLHKQSLQWTLDAIKLRLNRQKLGSKQGISWDMKPHGETWAGEWCCWPWWKSNQAMHAAEPDRRWKAYIYHICTRTYMQFWYIMMCNNFLCIKISKRHSKSNIITHIIM